MNRRDVENGIQRAWVVLEQLALAETFGTPGVLQVDQDFRDLSLSHDTRYSDLYMAGLRLACYNILLSDYSFLQFGWEDSGNVRYGYYPNPYISGLADVSRFQRLRKLVDDGAISVEEYHHLLKEVQPEGRVPFLRYENAPDQWKELRHPCSHWHIGHHADNRWASNRVLTPLAFVLIICKQYYSEEWAVIGDDDAAPLGNVFENMLIDERQNCRVIGSANFSANEARSFHLA